ncbi:hypothetical protein [Christiangramia crocea]|uniref:Uncharacterized protein n=1 Tax=Christiangramia crocea TaxID=2904124 RepID=A0A9X1UVN1_9FLAO|nr:hypothetical protein [Gramella crocea]MCG9970901.1 hypothetical protein [Gramella crocea]
MNYLKSDNILGLSALLFGVITLFASSSVLFNITTILQKNGNYPSFILWMNLLSSPLYLMAAVGLKLSKVWALHLLVAILTMLFISLTYFILLIKNNEAYELETLMALAIRIALTSTLAYFAFNTTIKEN